MRTKMSACDESQNVINCGVKAEKLANDLKTEYKWFLIVSLVMVTISCGVTILATLSVGSYFKGRLHLQSQEISDLQQEISQLKTKVESLTEVTESFKKENTIEEKRRHTRLKRYSRQTVLSNTERKALVTYIRWGANSCPGGDGSGKVVSGLLNGDIFALHSQDGNVAPGTDIICLSTPASTGNNSSPEGLSLEQLEFRMDHLDSNKYRNLTGGRLHCSYCQHAGSHVEILLGRTRCPSSSWKLMYTGKYVTAAGTSGTSSGICVSDRIDQPTTFPHQSGNTIATTIRSSSPHFTSSNLQVPCVICVLNERERVSRSRNYHSRSRSYRSRNSRR